MYVPPHFEEARLDELHRIIGQYPLGALVIKGPNGLDANHVPFELDGASGERGALRAHVARANPVWTEVRDGDDVLVIFRAADAYISPNWYPSKHEFHREVPTWGWPEPGRTRSRQRRRRAFIAIGNSRRWPRHRTPPAVAGNTLACVQASELLVVRTEGAGWRQTQGASIQIASASAERQP